MLLILFLSGTLVPPLAAQEATVEAPVADPNMVLPKAKVSPASPIIVVLGSALALGGVGVSGVGLYQRVEGIENWGTVSLVGGGLALGGFLFILLGGLTTAPYDQVPVELPSP